MTLMSIRQYKLDLFKEVLNIVKIYKQYDL